MHRYSITILLLLLFNIVALATHNRAGEITYKQISDYTYEFTVITFTNTKPTSEGVVPADRPQLEINWGDGTYSIMDRKAFYDLPDYYRKNVYKATHTYAGASTYEILVEDPNRNEGVDNIPNSVMVVFSIKTILQINPALGFNNTPILLNPPVDKAAVNQIFIHNPAAFDPDGDSLSYEMTVCTGENGEPIESYQFPESKFEPIYIDPITGNLIWNTPTAPGAYNVAFNIIEWRQGIKIGQITRDMQIEVYETENEPPKFDPVAPVCAIAGEKLELEVTARDNTNETITLTATGGVFEVDPPAEFSSEPSKGTVKGTLMWNTECTNVRQQPYQVIFKAVDDNSEVNLVDQISVDITVVGAPPVNLQLAPTNNSILLTWDKYACAEFEGFNIYRSVNAFGFTPDKCETGVPAYTGFELVATINDTSKNTYLDNNNEQGLNQGFAYCYMVTARFENNLESKSSEEACTELVRGTPIITNVSVTQHNEINGEIYVAWHKPIEFDTIAYPGDLNYIVKRANGIWGSDYEIIDTLYDFDTDTIYYDSGINTVEHGYSYQIEIHNAAGLTESPMTASSIFPSVLGANKKLTINFDRNTPWLNTEYVIYKQNAQTLSFDSIDVTRNEYYVDSMLINGNEYCYGIKSIGQYNLPGIVKPIVNQSHQNCGIPIDTIPPEPPVLKVESYCQSFVNELSWQLKNADEEILKYHIYGALSFDSEFVLIDSVNIKDTMHYTHVLNDILAGCYAVTSFDSSLNESNYSNIVCIDNCPYYELPNVFTPNGDGENDLYIPLTPPAVVEKYIDRIDMKIYSRWGNLVYETTNPKIEWDGKGKQSNKLLSTGVYYYVCEVYEKRISGIEHRSLTGFIHLFQGEKGKVNEK